MHASPTGFYLQELQFNNRLDEPNLAGAFDSDSFAIRVRGKQYVSAIKDFFQATKEGHVLFAGSFLDSFGSAVVMPGVVLADRRYLPEDTLSLIADAQLEFESQLRLKARDDSRDLLCKMIHLSGNQYGSPMSVWARWKDSSESEIAYHINPSRNSRAQYGGPYTKDQLLDWAKSGYSYYLEPTEDPPRAKMRP